MSNSNMKMIKKDDADDDRIKAIIEEELVRGREFANQLRQLIVINKTNNNEDHNHLLSNVISSFANTLSLLNKYPINPMNQSSSSASPNNNDLMQMQPPQPQQLHSRLLTYDHHICSTQPDRRGSYRRKRNMETWTKESEKEREEDGHQWRKYGQKAIQNEKYTRNYFRCTHKYEQGCQATKQVQKLQENPPLYRTTYYGRHTCTNNPDTNSHILIMEEDDPNNTSSSSSIFLSFDNSLPNPPTNPFFSSSTTTPPPKMTKEEEDLEVVPSSSSHPVLDDSSNNNNNNICWDDLMMMMVMSHHEALYGSVDDSEQ